MEKADFADCKFFGGLWQVSDSENPEMKSHSGLAPQASDALNISLREKQGEKFKYLHGPWWLKEISKKLVEEYKKQNRHF